MSLEFSEFVYTEMKRFFGYKPFFGRATDVVDTDRLTPPVARHFGCSPPTPRVFSCVGIENSATSAETASKSRTVGIPRDDMPGSTGRKSKAMGTCS